MISAVSRVSFRGNEADFQQLIQSEGKYTQKNGAATAPAQQTPVTEAPAKKGKAGKIIGGTLAAVVIAGLALFGLKRGNVIKIDKEASGFFGKMTSKLAEAGEWIGTKMIDPIVNIFKKKGAEVADKAGDEAKSIIA